MKYKEVERPAKVGDVIKIVDPDDCNLEIRDKFFRITKIYGDRNSQYFLSDMFNNPVYFKDSNCSLWVFSSEFIVLEPIEKRHRPTKAENYLAIAKAVSERSTCIRRQYGAVIVKNDEIIATGYNGAPRGAENCCDTGWCGREGHNHNDGDYSTCPAVHAEANAIISAARRDMIGSTLYLYGSQDGKTITAEPCPICKGLIANAGIADVVCSKEDEKNDT